MPERSSRIDARLKERLIALATALVDQARARVLVPPQQRASGFWFGGGNAVRAADGTWYLAGRYRNQGDSRTGLAAGTRGLELAVFAAPGFFGPFEKVKSFSKADLSAPGRAVISIEGSALFQAGDRLELYVSSEKDLPYPAPVRPYQKSGTGVWSIDRLQAADVSALDPATLQPALASDEPATLHVKDPVVFDHPAGGTAMIFCSHPFTWSSSNSGLAVRKPGQARFTVVAGGVLGRGPVWDVAATRITDRLPVPRLGPFRDLPPLSLYFYDGAECLRPHEQHAWAVRRPRGHSCEEIGGLAWGFDHLFPRMERLSVECPLFVSPYGTGCSRYVSTLVTEAAIYASWQQSQPDLSQPLVGHALPMEVVEAILSGEAARRGG